MNKNKTKHYCYKCFDYYDITAEYKINGKYYCADCAWELLKSLDTDTYEEEITAYYVNGEYVGEDLDEAIEDACDYEGLDFERVEN